LNLIDKILQLSKTYGGKVVSQVQKKNIAVIGCIFLMMLIFMPNSQIFLVENNAKIKETQDMTTDKLTILNDDIPQTQAALNPSQFSQFNVSQFNVTEKVTSIAPQTTLDISTNNFTLGIPQNWNFENQLMNISAVYKASDVITDGAINQSYNWGSLASPTYSLAAPYFMVNSTSGGSLSGGVRKNPLQTGTITMQTGSYVAFGQQILKKDSDLSIQETEFLRSGSLQYPIYDDFNIDPVWTKLLNNPFGGQTQNAKTVLQWNPGNLECYIKAGSTSLQLGNPSIAWQKDFSFGLIVPKQVLFSVTWSVENLNYEMNDNFMVIARVDGNFVNGTKDYLGNTYFGNATSMAIEYDGFSEAETISHNYITRIFDITNLINSNFNVHSLELGIWFSNIDETNDEVRVRFDQVIIRAEEVDQYKIGEFRFDSQVTFTQTSDLNDWVVFAKIENDKGLEETSILGNLSQFTVGGTFSNNITSRSKEILNSSIVILSFGVYLTRNKVFTRQWDINFDNIVLNLTYAQTNLSKLQLYYTTGGTPILVPNWVFVTNIPTSASYLNFSFSFNPNSPYIGSKMKFQSILTISKLNIECAVVDYSISGFDSVSLNKIQWYVKYNNSGTINANWNYFNFNFSRYQFTLIDLPAWDGLGNESSDWDSENVINPLGLNHNPNAIIRTNGTNNFNIKQNFTIQYTNLEFGTRILNGTWISIFTSPNYIAQVALYNNNLPLSKVYEEDASDIVVNQTILGYGSNLVGNYNLTLFNGSNSLHANFPMYNQSVLGNLTRDWPVKDDGIGQYTLYAVWNDTDDITGQTLRVGIRYYTFEMWRKTTATLLVEPGSLNSGAKGTFYFNYTQIIDDYPITNAATFITLYNNASGDNDNIWGYDWPPYISLIDSVNENLSALGHYNLTFRTLGVPPNNYSVYLNISKPFYDHVTLDSFINITGNPLNLSVIYGASNQTGNWIIDANNIPSVNDTFTSWIVLKITDETQTPVTGGIISGRFNGSKNVFYGYDIYSYTFNEADKGLYNISLNTMGLNATSPYNPEINNYNLTITITVASFSPSSIIISTVIKPLPTAIAAVNTPNLYEAGSFEIYANFQNILNPNNPLPLNGGSLAWTISANSSVFATGYFTFVLSGVYKAIISLETDSYYIEPGIYNFSINGSQRNCEYAEWYQYNLTVYEKNATQISVSINPIVRIGQNLNIIANLTFIDGKPIRNEDVEIKITYKGTDSFSVLQKTDANGIATYSQIVPYNYAFTIVTVNVTFNGNSSIDSCTVGVFQEIKGPYAVNLTLNALNEIRVGYNVTLGGNITIEEQTTYSNIFVTIAAWYDGQKTSPIFIADVRSDELGYVTYFIPTIQDGHQNITFFMDYSGTSTIDYAQVNFTVQILPKWEIILNVTDLTPFMRIGYDMKFQINASFVNESTPEVFYGLPIYMDIEFASGSIPRVGSFFDVFGGALLSYLIPQTMGTWINVTIRFLGTSKIAGFSVSYFHDVLPKWDLSLKIDELPQEIRQGQTINLGIQAKFPDINCTESYLGLPITIRIDYGNGYAPIEVNGTLSKEGRFTYNFQIPTISISNMEIMISTIGTFRINSSIHSVSTSILQQKQTQILLLTSSTFQDFSGKYSFTVKIIDENSIGLENQNVFFILKDDQNNIIGNYSAKTNPEGIASALIEFNATGNYRIDVIFPSAGIYASVSLSGNDNIISVRIVDYSMLFIDYLPQILLALGIIIASAFAFHRTVIRPKQIRHQNALREIHRRFADVENIQYILIIHKDAGVPVFSRAFTEIPIDETLVSGFLSAINSFGAEIGAKVGQSQAPGDVKSTDMSTGLEELAYGMFKIAVFEGQFVRSAILLLKSASPSLKALMKQFNTEFEKEYHDDVEQFTGQIPDPEPIMEIVERILHADLLYKHNLVLNKVPTYMKQYGKKTLKGMILTEAQTPNFNNSFKVREMINTMAGFGKSDVATFNAIDDMRRAGVVFAVNSRTKSLMEKFKPLIDPLSANAKKFLKIVGDGQIDHNTLRKQLNMKDLDGIIAELNAFELIGPNKLTDTGVIIATLLNLMPEL
jgi:hypothetical protein